MIFDGLVRYESILYYGSSISHPEEGSQGFPGAVSTNASPTQLKGIKERLTYTPLPISKHEWQDVTIVCPFSQRLVFWWFVVSETFKLQIYTACRMYDPVVIHLIFRLSTPHSLSSVKTPLILKQNNSSTKSGYHSIFSGKSLCDSSSYNSNI
jgi:hypothetical protein